MSKHSVDRCSGESNNGQKRILSPDKLRSLPRWFPVEWWPLDALSKCDCSCIHQADNGEGDPNLPKAPLNTLLNFDLEIYQIPLNTLMSSKRIPDEVMNPRKYK